MDSSGYCIVLTTTSSEELADELAKMIIERDLGACVQIQQIKSYYKWEGKLCTEPEWLLTIKTMKSCYGELETAIATNHTYTTPEILQMPIQTGSANYLKWLKTTLGP